MQIKDLVKVTAGGKSYEGHIIAEGGEAYDFAVLVKLGVYYSVFHSKEEDIKLIKNIWN